MPPPTTGAIQLDRKGRSWRRSDYLEGLVPYGYGTVQSHRGRVRRKTLKYRDIIKAVEADGWEMVRQSGSHRQYRHPIKPGTVTISPHSLGDEVPLGTLNSIRKQAGLN